MRHNEQSSRQQKVAGLIRESLVEIFTKAKKLDIRLMNNKITITDVRVSADLRHANCYFLPFGGLSKLEDIEEGLEISKYAIRQQVTEKINLKFAPELKFFYDSGAINAMDVEKVIKNLNN
jgi:ribosome-binding factor A